MRIIATDFMPDFTGFSLDSGRYRLFENIGCGAYGKVHRAIDMSHPSSKKALAIKCLSRPTDPRSCLLQKRELEHHKLVSGHPNIVTFHRCFSDAQFVYVVLDLCDGGDLFSAIKTRLFDGNTCLTKSVFVQVIDAVAHCHRLGVFHRDIKPENILCSHDGSDIRLTDFGLSIMSPYSEDFRCGSSEYMSPECIGNQFCCREYATSYNDIWALGVILTNMITLRHPWKHASIRDDWFAAYLMDNDFLKQILPISEGVNNVLKDIFVVNPVRRLTLAKMRSRILALDALWSERSDILDEQAGSPELQSNIVPVHVLRQTDSSLMTTKMFGSYLTVPFSDFPRPITPTTRAVGVGSVDIPDISIQTPGDSTGSQKSSVIYKPQGVVKRGPADIFRAAVRHIKNWYKADPVA